MDRPRQPLLAHAGFTQDEQRTIGVHDATDHPDEGSHYGASRVEVSQVHFTLVHLGLQLLVDFLLSPAEQGDKRLAERFVGQAGIQNSVTTGGQQPGPFFRVLPVPDDDHRGLIGQTPQRPDRVRRRARQQHSTDDNEGPPARTERGPKSPHSPARIPRVHPSRQALFPDERPTRRRRGSGARAQAF